MIRRVVVVDVGNFALKARFYRDDDGQWTAEGAPLVVDLQADTNQPETSPPAAWQKRVARWYQTHAETFSLDRQAILPWRVASVNPPPTAWLEGWVRGDDPPLPRPLLSRPPLPHLPHAWHAIRATDIPLDLAIRHPERVGIDRLVAAWAAWRGCTKNAANDANAHDARLATGQAWHFPADPAPARAVMVVDAGSAMTVDLVTADGTFLGGAILPGRQMQLKSLGVGAFALPDLSHPAWPIAAAGDPTTPAEANTVGLDPTTECPGQDTVAAIELGVSAGMLGAIRQLRDAYTARLGSPPELIVTGGDAARLAPLLGATATWVPDLVLEGLAQLEVAPPSV